LDIVLPAVERLLLGSLLFHHRAVIIPSEKERGPYLMASKTWLDNAMTGARMLEGAIGDHHVARCLYMSGVMAGEVGDLGTVIAAMTECRAISERRRFSGLGALCALELAPLMNERAAGDALLTSAETELKRLGNTVMSYEALFLKGLIICTEGSTARDLSDGADLMLKAACGLDGGGFFDEGARKRLEAALWLSRAGRTDDALLQVKDPLRHLRRIGDVEGVSLAMAAGFLALIRKGDRRGAKRTLLGLVLKYPVKQYRDAYEVLKEGVSGQEWLREDPDTSEMFKDVPVHVIERGAVNEIISRAKDAYPNEFGAMLRGIDRITHIEPILDSASGRAVVMFSLFDRLSQRSISGEGVVHSHPSGSTRPSGADLQMFSRFPGINIIIGFPFTEGTMTAYDRLGNMVELDIV
jgi:proteasome lid subunit RPN8/RPN11